MREYSVQLAVGLTILGLGALWAALAGWWSPIWHGILYPVKLPAVVMGLWILATVVLAWRLFVLVSMAMNSQPVPLSEDEEKVVAVLAKYSMGLLVEQIGSFTKLSNLRSVNAVNNLGTRHIVRSRIARYGNVWSLSEFGINYAVKQGYGDR
ncbi:MAG TPA: hypothetical protein VF292_16180 [Rhodanobacteraceae bacterium]